MGMVGWWDDGRVGGDVPSHCGTPASYPHLHLRAPADHRLVSSSSYL